MPIDIHRDDVQRLVAEGAQLVEVLPEKEYTEEHLPGAINTPLRKLDRDSAASSTRIVLSSSTATTTPET